MDEATTLVERVISHCRNERFTGVLRIRAREGEGEIWFLSGITDEVRFGVSTGDEALERLNRANDPKFELVPRLPSPAGGFKRGHPLQGTLDEVTGVDLFRFCETYALTCRLDLETGGNKVEANYELGELVSVDTDAENDEAVAQMLESKNGTYQVWLPPVELPAGIPVQQRSLVPGPDSAAPPISAQAEAAAAKPADAPVEAVVRQKTEEEEIKRRAVQIASRRKSRAPGPPEPDDAARQKAEAEAAAQKQKAEAEAAAKRAEEEARRRAAEEAKRKAEAEAQKKRAEEEAARRAAEEAKKQADAAAAEKRKAEEEARRKAEEEAAAKQKAEEAAAAKKKAEEEEAAARKEAEEKAAVAKKKAKEEAAAAAAAKEAEEEADEEEEREEDEDEREPSEPPPPAEEKGPAWGIIAVIIALVAITAYFMFGRR